MIWDLLASILWYIIIPYTVYTRVLLVYYTYYFYAVKQRDKVGIAEVPKPFVGQLYSLIRGFNNENKHPIYKAFEMNDLGCGYGKTSAWWMLTDVFLVVNDVAVAEDLYVKHNASFCKHPQIRNLTNELLG